MAESVKAPLAIAAFVITGMTSNSAQALPAFLGAEGFGSSTAHARGTGVCIVDNLLDADKTQSLKFMIPGSFRYCLAKAETEGGSYVIFNTSGLIRLARPALIPSNTYVAGQTSPGGIALEGQAVVIKNALDVVVRHIRHRGARTKGDAFSINNSQSVVLDHVSISFFKDGAVDIVNGSTDITVQWSHMGDAIDSGARNERYHGQPNLIRSGVDRISLHHNYYSHVHTRAPLVQHTVATPGFTIEFSNNVIYNYGKYPSRFAAVAGRGNVIGNLYIPGKNTHADASTGPRGSKGINAFVHPELPAGVRPPILVENGMRLYLRDNVMRDGVGHDASIFTDEFGKQIETGRPGPVTGVRTSGGQDESRMVASGSGKVLLEPQRFEALEARDESVPPLTIYPHSRNFELLMQRFGALPRDNTDRRLAREVQDGTGGWKYEKPGDENRYPHTPWLDSDADGLPDDFELASGKDLNPLGRDLDASRDNLEIYLDELAQALLRAAGN